MLNFKTLMAKQTHESKLTLTVLWLNTVFKGKVTFCGSLGLKLNGKLTRKVHDIDCITDKDHYGIDPQKWLPKNIKDAFEVYQGNSAKFKVNGVLVKCFKMTSPQGIHVDVMYRPDGVKSTNHELNGKIIKVEVPESAIAVKKYYLKNWSTMDGCTGASYEKHKTDLIKLKEYTDENNIDSSSDIIDTL